MKSQTFFLKQHLNILKSLKVRSTFLVLLLIVYLFVYHHSVKGFPRGSDGKESSRNVGDPSSIPGLGKSPGGGNGNPFQYSCMENSMDRGAWRATIHRVAKSWTWLSNFTFTFIQLKYVNWNFDRNLKAHLPSLSHHVRNSRTRAFPI